MKCHHLSNRWIDYIEKNLIKGKKGIGFITTAPLHTLVVLITCTYNGQVLMLAILILEKLIESFFYFGRHVKQITGVLDWII